MCPLDSCSRDLPLHVRGDQGSQCRVVVGDVSRAGVDAEEGVRVPVTRGLNPQNTPLLQLSGRPRGPLPKGHLVGGDIEAHELGGGTPHHGEPRPQPRGGRVLRQGRHPGSGNGPLELGMAQGTALRHGWRCLEVRGLPSRPGSCGMCPWNALYLPVTVAGTSREVVTGGQEVGQPPGCPGGHRECPTPAPLRTQHRGGLTSRGSWEKGQVGTGSISEVACARSTWECPRGPDPNVTKQERGRASSQAKPVARALFSIPRVSKGCWERRKISGKVETPVQSPMSLRYSRERGQRHPLPQRDGSNRYSRSGCRSLCSLFLFLANSLSMAITSVSNSVGVGFASGGETGKNQLSAVLWRHAGVPGRGHTYQWPSNKCPSRYWAR